MPDFNSLQELLDHHKLPFELRADQVEDVDNLYGFERIALFNEVGTGKTATSTVLALAWDTDHNIVLMPPILLRQWQRWLESLHDVGSVLVYRGQPKERAAMDLTRHRWILMTIQIFKKDLPEIKKALGDRSVTTIVDEGHSIKNVGSANHKAVREFTAGQHLQILTGTPVSQPGDAYGYCKLKTPQVYRSEAQFMNLHVEERDFFGNVTKWQNLDLMNKNLMLQASRRLSRQVLDLKEVNYIPITYALEPEHLALYNQLADEQLLLLPDGGKIDATSAGRLYNALQQIVVNWDHFSGEPSHKSAAFDLVDLVVDEVDLFNRASSKLIIFMYYVLSSRKMVAYLQGLESRVGGKLLKLNPVAIFSEISAAKQRANLDSFLEDPECRVLVIQTGSGVGFNPQKICWEVLFIEEPVIPAHFVQSVGRIDRDGQIRAPNVRIGIADQTIQVHLHDRLLKKDNLANRVQGGFKDLRDAIHGKVSRSNG